MNNKKGWIKIHRRLVDWEWYDDIPTFKLFIHLLLTANHEQKKWRGIELQPGQIITGRRKLSKLTKLTERQVRTCLHRLSSTHEIAIKKTNKYSIITIVNWDLYQANVPLEVHQTTTTKECKEVKNNIYCPLDHSAQEDDTENQDKTEQVLNPGESSPSQPRSGSDDWKVSGCEPGSPPIALAPPRWDSDLRSSIEKIYKEFYPRRVGTGKKSGIDNLIKQIKKPEDLEDFRKACKNYSDICISENREQKYIKMFKSFVGTKSGDQPWRDYVEPETPQLKTLTIVPMGDL